MDQELRFLEAIRARPRSNQLRLVYSDWLEDQGDPRADFVRLQCQAATLAASSPRRLTLEAEAHALLLRHEAEWLGPMLGHVTNWEFSRGLIRSVTVPAETFLAHAETWLPRLPLLGIHLRNAHGHVAALAECPQLAHLNALYLGDNDLTDDDLRVLLRSRHLGRVTELYLQSNHLTTAGIRRLASSRRLPRLRELNLGANHVGADGWQALAKAEQLQSLRHLRLTMTFPGVEGLQVLAGSALLGRLHTLDLTSNVLPGGALKTLVESPAFAAVRRLHYDLNETTDADVQALAASPHARNLTALSLSANAGLSDASLTALASSPHLRRLRSLVVGRCRGRAGLTDLGRSRTLGSLRRLHLGVDYNPPEPQVGHFLRGPLVRRLRVLSFDGAPVGPDGLAALASHPAPLRLRQLDLGLRQGDAAAWEALLARGTLAELTTLIAYQMPPTSLQALLPPGRLPNLRTLHLDGLPPDPAETQSFLDSELARQLQHLDLSPHEEKHGLELLRGLTRSPATAGLQHLGLHWPMTPEQARVLTESGDWPRLTSLYLDPFRLDTAGAQALADWPLLGHLRHLTLRNSSAQELPGLVALADSPHPGPLLRVDLHNGSVPADVRARLQKHLGGRWAGAGRRLPRVVPVGRGARLTGEDD
jgi:uncharacterized protein (TIGR02996 family)